MWYCIMPSRTYDADATHLDSWVVSISNALHRYTQNWSLVEKWSRCCRLWGHFLRATAECIARLSHRWGVRPSVCLSVCHTLYCIKTVQVKITKFLLWAAPKTLVHRDEISCSSAKGFSLKESVITRCFIKRRPFSFFRNSVKWWPIYMKFFLPDIAEEILIQNIWTKYGC